MRVCVGGLDHDERLTIYDLFSVKQRFAQLTTFKCHPTAKSAYQRKVLHENEDVLWRSHLPPSSTKWDFPPSAFSQQENVNVDVSGVGIPPVAN